MADRRRTVTSPSFDPGDIGGGGSDDGSGGGGGSDDDSGGGGGGRDRDRDRDDDDDDRQRTVTQPSFDSGDIGGDDNGTVVDRSEPRRPGSTFDRDPSNPADAPSATPAPRGGGADNAPADGSGGGSPGGSSPPPSDVGGPATGSDSGGSAGPSRQGREDRTDGDGGASVTSPAPNQPSQPQGSQPEDTAPDQPSAVDRARETLADAGQQLAEFGANAREFQRETTPVEDAGAEIRDRLGLASESELAAEANDLIGDAVGTTPREARLRARGEAITGLSEGADAVEDTVPGGRDTLTGAAVVAAAAEPTPVGEALLFGGATAGALGGSAASNPEQGDQLVPESPVTQREIDAPSDPATDRSELDVADGTDAGEIGLPDDLTTLGGTDEISTPTDPAPQSAELDVPTGQGRDLSTLRAAQLIGRQQGRQRDSGTDGFRRDRDDELQEILSGGGTLGQIEESGEPSVEDGADGFEQVPEDFTSRPTGFEGFEPADTGVGEPTFPETDPGTGVGSGGTQTPPLPPAGRQDTPGASDGVGQGQPTGQTPGADVFTTPDIDIGTDFDFGVDQPTPTRPRQDFNTPTPTDNPTDTPNRFGQPDPTATPPDQTTSETIRRRRPRFDGDDDTDDEPAFLLQTDDALLDSGISGVDDLLTSDRDGLL